MATKKNNDAPSTISNINTNNNTNNVNVNVKLEQPKAASQNSPPPQKTKLNWVVKTIVIGIIGLALSLLGFYIKRAYDGGTGQPSAIESNVPRISAD